MVEDKDLHEFQIWLEGTGYFNNERSISNVVSRIRRVFRIVQLQEVEPDQLLENLKNSNEYNRMTKTVRSQLKRAILLYTEYLSKK